MTDLLTRLSSLEEKATPAPWEFSNGGFRTYASCTWHVQGRAGDLAQRDSWSDADLVVALRNAWPSLKSRLEAAEAMEEALKAMLLARPFRCDCVGSPAARCHSCRSELSDREKARAALSRFRASKEE